MNSRATMMLMNAAWREAARRRAAVIEVTDLLLGLLAWGGPCAQILAEHGVTLAVAREAAENAQRHRLTAPDMDVDMAVPPLVPRPVEELHHGAVGDLFLDRQSRHLLDSLPRGWSETDLLAVLLREPTRRVAELLDHAGADPEVLHPCLSGPLMLPTPVPRRLRATPPLPALSDEVRPAVMLDFFISAAPRVVHHAATDAACALRWAHFYEGAVVDGHGLAATERGHGHPIVFQFTRMVADTDRVVWVTTRDGVPVGWHEICLSAVAGGTQVVMTQGTRVHGRLSDMMNTFSQIMTSVSLPTTAQDLTSVCSELVDVPR
ncbi:hypothetical protein KEM60_01699 [Austwickia sp. TVS 96-490-7B]|uniref:Clp protease N-terminal domain-containing protein n=1 Tax=Austwickia sp. TVS 96-490-7B TaxID=2830843 RepID=UPI001C57481B|nr:Clp protease N-terminal domain-containing protein [Austwickia sp. TVS 96-490-7B]MBW3085499.1 hypothetical protein [Austwickia sp. TVS 96-490-7B]